MGNVQKIIRFLNLHKGIWESGHSRFDLCGHKRSPRFSEGKVYKKQGPYRTTSIKLAAFVKV